MTEELKSFTVEEVYQIIKDLDFIEDLNLSPEQVKRFFVSNVVQRTLSHLFGYTGKSWLPINISESGKLETLSAGGGFDDYVVTTITAEGAETEYDLGLVTDRTDITLTTGGASLKFAGADKVYGDYIPCEQFASSSFPIRARYIKMNPTYPNVTMVMVSLY